MEIVAHRGASADAPENSVAAYDRALADGADALEIDLRLTADARVVALHDPTLARTHGDTRAVADVALDDLAALDDPPPLLAKLLRDYPHEALLLELKDSTPALERRVLKAVGRARAYERVTLQSFDHGGLRRIARTDPRAAIAPLYDNAELDLDAAVAWGACAIGVRSDRIDAALVDDAHTRGLGVRAWTVNAPAEAVRLAALGIDGLITDAPGRMRALLAADALAA